MDTAMNDLLKALGSIGEAHEFAVFGERPPILPGLRVEGVGEVGLPVDADEARALIGVAQQAPYGRGEETIVDPAVRSVWQIGPERLDFDNPKWTGLLDELVAEVASAFAIRRPIQRQLYKLLIYEEGSHFAPHKDSEKADGMFATLVVYLPSRNQGGRLAVRHRGEERIFEPGGDGAAFTLRWAAFYADCEHEIEPLTSGYRIALVYTLSLSGSNAELSAPEHSGPAGAVSDALARLFDDKGFQRLAISLDHEYTEASLGPAALKGADRPRFEVLAGVAAERGYECSLALLTHYQSGEADYATLGWEPMSWRGRRGQRGAPGGPDYDISGVEIEEIYEEEWKLEHWVAADGRPRTLGTMNIDPGEIVRDPDLELPYEQEVHEATGNEGVSVDRWYHEAVVVLWPRSLYVDLLAREGRALAVPALAEMIEKRGGLDGDAERLRFASAILDHWGRPPYQYFQDELTSRMLRCLTLLGDAELGARFLREVMPDAIGAERVSGLAALCERLGWTPCREPIVEMVAAQADPTRYPDFPTLVAAVTGLCAGGSMTAPRREVCRAAMEALADVAASLEDRPDDWRNRDVLDRSAVLAPVAIALKTVGALEHFAPFVDRSLADPTRYDLRTILVPAAVAIHAEGDAELDADPAVRRLHEHVVAELLAATVSAPEAPTDWRQAVTLRHRCADCLELEAFANDPEAQVHRFKVGKDRRRHLHDQIDHPDHEDGRLYMTHVTERSGNPHTLVCTKTRAGYQLAVERYTSDLRALEALGAGRG